MLLGHLIIDFTNSIVLFSALAFIFLIIKNIYVSKFETLEYFSLLLLSAALYLISYYLEFHTNSIAIIKNLYSLETLSICFFPTFGILFVLQLTQAKKPPIKLIISLFSLSVVFWVFYVTNRYHDLFFTWVNLSVNEFGTVFKTQKGPIYYAVLLYAIIFIILSSILFYRAAKSQTHSERKKNYIVMLLAIQLSWVPVFLLFFGLDQKIDPIPYSMIFICAMLYRNNVKNNLLGYKDIDKNYRNLITQMPQGLAVHEIICDEKGNPIDYRYISVNEGFEKLTGLKRENILGKTVLEVLPNTEKYWIEQFGKVATGGKPIQYENYSAELGKYFQIYAYSPRPFEFAVIIDDITFRKAVEQELETEKELLKATLLSVGDGVISTDANGNILLINEMACKLTGYSEEEALGKNLGEVFHIINEFTRESCDCPVKTVLNQGETIELANHTILITKDQNELSIENTVAPIKDRMGNITGVVLVFRDFTEKKEKQNQVLYLSYHDQLTGLKNRRFFEDELIRIDRKQNLPISMIMIDVNGLKLVNDAFGHSIGDKVLIKVSEILKKECVSRYSANRIAGDEFVILLPKTDYETAKGISERINSAILEEKIYSICLSVSIGIAEKADEHTKLIDIYKKAEDNMYKKKLFESASTRYKTVDVIMKTLHEKSQREENHSKRVGALCKEIGVAMGLSSEVISELEASGLMHDIGKISIRDEILNKPTPHDEIERLEMRRHCQVGYNILSCVNEYAQMAKYVVSHHERWDGTGYPRGLKGEQIPLQARIIAVADAYDAMTSARAYRSTLTREQAIEELKKNVGLQFDPEIIKIFIENNLG